MKNVIIISRPFRPARRIATEINLKKDCVARIIDPKKIIGFNTDNTVFYVSISDDVDPVEIKTNSISLVIAYSKHTILSYFDNVLGIKVINNYFNISLASNKYLSSLRMKLNNVDTPKEILLSTNVNLEWITNQFSFPFIVKRLIGSQGKGVFLITNKVQLETLTKKLFKNDKSFLIQSFVNTSLADDKPHDYRVFVVNGEIVATMKRIATTGIKTNHSIHKNSKPFIATAEMEKLALAAYNASNLDICGVDIAFDVNRGVWTCYELNSCPGFGIEFVTKVNIAEQIATSYLSNAEDKGKSYFPLEIAQPKSLFFKDTTESEIENGEDHEEFSIYSNEAFRQSTEIDKTDTSRTIEKYNKSNFSNKALSNFEKYNRLGI